MTALIRLAYARWVPLIGREPLPTKVDYSAAIRNHRLGLLYAGSDMAVLIETIRRDDDLLIDNVAVASHFQKRGYAFLQARRLKAAGRKRESEDRHRN